MNITINRKPAAGVGATPPRKRVGVFIKGLKTEGTLTAGGISYDVLLGKFHNSDGTAAAEGTKIQDANHAAILQALHTAFGTGDTHKSLREALLGADTDDKADPAQKARSSQLKAQLTHALNKAFKENTNTIDETTQKTVAQNIITALNTTLNSKPSGEVAMREALKQVKGKILPNEYTALKTQVDDLRKIDGGITSKDYGTALEAIGNKIRPHTETPEQKAAAALSSAFNNHKTEVDDIASARDALAEDKEVQEANTKEELQNKLKKAATELAKRTGDEAHDPRALEAAQNLLNAQIDAANTGASNDQQLGQSVLSASAERVRNAQADAQAMEQAFREAVQQQLHRAQESLKDSTTKQNQQQSQGPAAG